MDRIGTITKLDPTKKYVLQLSSQHLPRVEARCIADKIDELLISQEKNLFAMYVEDIKGTIHFTEIADGTEINVYFKPDNL